MNFWGVKAGVYFLRESFLLRWILRGERSRLRQLFPADDAEVILDIGSGTGSNLGLLPAGSRIIALDRSLPMLRKIPRRPRLTTIAADAACLPFRDGSFTHITMIGVSEYLADPAPVLREAARLLQPSGHLLLTASPPSIWTALRQLLGDRIHARTGAALADTAGRSGLTLTGSARSLMQIQLLFRRLPAQSGSLSDSL